MPEMDASARIVTASRELPVPAATLFELIADPSAQPSWDGNDNLAESSSPRIRKVGDVFLMTNADGQQRENHVVEFEEGRRIAWLPAPAGEQARGHLWRWELEPVSDSVTRVTHTYDWTNLTDESRFARALATTEASLEASIAGLERVATTGADRDGLAGSVERPGGALESLPGGDAERSSSAPVPGENVEAATPRDGASESGALGANAAAEAEASEKETATKAAEAADGQSSESTSSASPAEDPETAAGERETPAEAEAREADLDSDLNREQMRDEGVSSAE